MKINVHQLRSFVTVVDSGGIHRAAARLNLSQPALSRQINALEAALGITLFDRVGRRLKLTAEGEGLLRLSRHLLGEVEAFSERASALKKGETGILRVAATPQVIENTLSHFLGRYRRRYPGVEVQLVEDGGIAMPRRLEFGDVHLALMAVDDPRFRTRLLYPVRGLAVMPNGHKLGSRRIIEVAELADQPLLLLRSEFASRAWFETACRLGRIRPRVLLESGAPHTVIALAAAGYGIAVVPSTVVIPAGRVRGIPLIQRGAAVGRWLRIAWQPERFLSVFAQRFIDELWAHCRRSYPGREFNRHAPALPRPGGDVRPARTD
ncbi:MAG TPA: LysR family transcriptional regulator [Xanthobacteraceae bacterium]|nr:LysR family transcriptional regulator [Xanthobacteraceae bacterium]